MKKKKIHLWAAPKGPPFFFYGIYTIRDISRFNFFFLFQSKKEKL